MKKIILFFPVICALILAAIITLPFPTHLQINGAIKKIDGNTVHETSAVGSLSGWDLHYFFKNARLCGKITLSEKHTDSALAFKVNAPIIFSENGYAYAVSSRYDERSNSMLIYHIAFNAKNKTFIYYEDVNSRTVYAVISERDDEDKLLEIAQTLIR